MISLLQRETGERHVSLPGAGSGSFNQPDHLADMSGFVCLSLSPLIDWLAGWFDLLSHHNLASLRLKLELASSLSEEE